MPQTAAVLQADCYYEIFLLVGFAACGLYNVKGAMIRRLSFLSRFFPIRGGQVSSMMQLGSCLGRKSLKEENVAWELKSNQTRKKVGIKLAVTCLLQ